MCVCVCVCACVCVVSYVMFNCTMNHRRAGMVRVKFPLTLHHPQGNLFQQNLWVPTMHYSGDWGYSNRTDKNPSSSGTN